MSSEKKENIENAETKNRQQYVANLEKTVQWPQDERKRSISKPLRRRRKPPRKVAYTFLFFGIIALVSSIIYNSSILALIGLGLTLCGGLFLYVRAARYVKEDVLDSTAISSLMIIDKILTELNYKGKGIYLPPRHLKELKESIVFVPARKEVLIPPAKDVAQGKLFLNPHGICLTTPGQGLLTLYEEKLGTDLSKTNLNYLKNNLPKLLIEDLEILEDLEIEEQGDKVHVKMRLSAYKGLCSQVRKQTDICSRLGCPLCSSIAGALAKATDKAVVIERNEVSSEGKTVEKWYSLMKY